MQHRSPQPHTDLHNHIPPTATDADNSERTTTCQKNEAVTAMKTDEAEDADAARAEDQAKAADLDQVAVEVAVEADRPNLRQRQPKN